MPPEFKIPFRAGAKPVATYTPAIMTNATTARADGVYLTPYVIEDLIAHEALTEDVAVQTEYILDELSALLADKGHDLRHVVALRLQIESMAGYGAMNTVYGSRSRNWGKNPPAREAVAIGSKLPPGVKIRMSGMAMLAGEEETQDSLPDVSTRLDISGQIAVTAGSAELLYPENVVAQCHVAMENLDGLLEAAGGDPTYLESARIYVTQEAHRLVIPTVKEHYPRASVSHDIVDGLPLGAFVEIAGLSESIPAEASPIMIPSVFS